MLQTHYQVLRPATTAHLAQTMTLLSLTTGELRQQIEAELSANPALELIEERRCPVCNRILPPKGPCPICSKPNSLAADEPVVFISPNEDFYYASDRATSDAPEFENFSPSIDDLPTYVLKQIAPELDPMDRELAAFILTHLDEDGFLQTTRFEIARYKHIPLPRIDAIIALIQHADPVGVGSSGPQEALRVQLDVLSETGTIPEHSQDVIAAGIDLLSRHQYPDIARIVGISVREVHRISQFITDNLNPYPARSHWGDTSSNGISPVEVYHQPDIIISYQNNVCENRLMIEIIYPLGGTLRVNPQFRQAIQQASNDKIDAWKSDLEKASLFVKCLQQRNHTMLRLMHEVAGIQDQFIRKGEVHLKPLTRALIAQTLGVHESTISRAVSGKALQLPNGRIIPLSMLFDRSLNVRSVLKEIINQETKPLSDTDLADILAQKGYQVARRTVAKYRTMEGILPAHMRKNLVYKSP